MKDTEVALRAELKDVEVRLDRKIETLERGIDGLDRKIAITARDLTIRGAGGLVIIASLMIGLKLFG